MKGKARLELIIADGLPMVKSRGVIATLLAVILVIVLPHLITTKEPAYEGKTLTDWFAEYTDQSFNWPRSNKPVDFAIRHLGTNTFADIKERLEFHDSPTGRRLAQFLRGYPRVRRMLGIKNQWDCNVQALAALQALGCEAKPLVPDLVKALDRMQMNSINQRIAEEWLRSLGPDAEAALPALILRAKDQNNRLRFETIKTIAIIGSRQTNLVLQVLLEGLLDPDKLTRVQATNELSRKPWAKLSGFDRVSNNGTSVSPSKSTTPEFWRTGFED